MLKRIRPLSVAIFVTVLMLTVRLGSFWQDLAIEVGATGEAQAPAKPAPANAPPINITPARPAPNPPAASPLAPPPRSNQPAPPAAANQPAPPAAAPAQSNAAQAASDAPAGVATNKVASKDAVADPGETGQPSPALPLDFTASEVSLLQSLSLRREEIDRRAQQVELREGLLKATEKRLDDKIAKLEELQGTLKNLLKQFDTKTDSQLQSLVKIYETMKPRDAARIWDELDMPVLLQVVERMREQKAAPILAAMNPDVAKRVTDELVRRRQLPGAAVGPSNG